MRDGFKQGLDEEAIGIATDRVETAAFEFERRVASAWDAAERCKEQTRLAGELERLGRRSRDLMEYVQSLRRAGPTATAALLTLPSRFRQALIVNRCDGKRRPNSNSPCARWLQALCCDAERMFITANEEAVVRHGG